VTGVGGSIAAGGRVPAMSARGIAMINRFDWRRRPAAGCVRKRRY